MRRRPTRKRPEGAHHICLDCDAVIPSEKCPAERHWLQTRIGRGAHRVVRCNGDCLADRIGVEAARSYTMKYSIGLWTDADLIARLEELRVLIEARAIKEVAR